GVLDTIGRQASEVDTALHLPVDQIVVVTVGGLSPRAWNELNVLKVPACVERLGLTDRPPPAVFVVLRNHENAASTPERIGNGGKGRQDERRHTPVIAVLARPTTAVDETKVCLHQLQGRGVEACRPG